MTNKTELPDLDRLRQIGELIETQDNRITDQPMFIVQQRRRVYGFDTDYCENVIWLCSEDDYTEASAEEATKLEAEYQESGRVKSGWQRTGYTDQWEFVTACFTEQGCKDYLQRDGHNLKEPRIYAEGSYRNEEFRAVRDSLIALARRAKPEGEAQQAEPWREYAGKLRSTLYGIAKTFDDHELRQRAQEAYDWPAPAAQHAESGAQAMPPFTVSRYSDTKERGVLVIFDRKISDGELESVRAALAAKAEAPALPKFMRAHIERAIKEAETPGGMARVNGGYLKRLYERAQQAAAPTGDANG